ncbi:MAG: hypothetical protein GY796_21045 [Chloroflexi bacterium]|nr:hypothetical protein [Chloroflexota bacterium]
MARCSLWSRLDVIPRHLAPPYSRIWGEMTGIQVPRWAGFWPVIPSLRILGSAVVRHPSAVI